MLLQQIPANIPMIKEFLKEVLNCEYGISDTLKQELNSANRGIEELNENEIVKLCEKVFEPFTVNHFYNLFDEKGHFILPNIYTDFYFESNSDNLFCIGKYGIQSLDLYNRQFKKIYNGAYWIDFHSSDYVQICDQKGVSSIYYYDIETEEINFIYLPINPLIPYIEFHENLYFIDGGFVNQKFELQTPNCFEYAKPFNEGQAAVCLNGKWGYINSKSEITIDFIYGAAESFTNGVAKVFILFPEYEKRKGVWIEVEERQKQNMYNSKQSYKKYMPLGKFRNQMMSIESYNEKYHYFGEGVNEKYGYWIFINQIGEILPDNTHLDKNTDEIIAINNQFEKLDFKYWLDLLSQKDNFKNLYDLPDELFINKEFVNKLLNISPEYYRSFICYYNDDDDISLIALTYSLESYNLFSERLKTKYLNLYEANLYNQNESDQKKIDEKYSNLTDDLPF